MTRMAKIQATQRSIFGFRPLVMRQSQARGLIKS